MEKDSVPNNREDHIELPPGFRFHPTDEELITHYLSNKVVDSGFNARAIGEVDLNKCEPWDLPWKAKLGEKEWYFFCVRDRKYPTGLRTNRATEAGYWKATGKDKEIFRGKTLVGMKKTLVFYKGRAPKGEKTNWVMHEYRLETKLSPYKTPKMAKNEWVISRVFQKSPSGKKTHLSSLLSSLMDSPASSNRIKTTTFPDPPHVTCFSNPMDDQKRQQQELIHCFNSSLLSSPFIFPNPSSVLMQEKVVFRALLESHGSVMKQNFKSEKGLAHEMMNIENTSVVSNHEMGQRHFDQFQQAPSPSAGPVDFDCLWNY